MEKIAIIGAGLMGHGIAQVFALHGHSVNVFDTSVDALAVLRDRVRKNLTDLDQNLSAAELVFPCPVMTEAVRHADVVFEAGPENLAIKQKLFEAIEQYAPRHALLASNTSVIPITSIMLRLKHQDRSLGTHWWNPPFLVPLVEVIQTTHTSADAMQSMTDLLTRVGKTPVTVKKDVPGFVGNRLQHALWREAIALVQEGVCDAETVDIVVKKSFGRRLAVLGPLENADLVGTDLTAAIHQTVLPSLNVSAEPLPYLQQLIADGKLGMKSGEGFQKWTDDEQAALRNKVFNYLKNFEQNNL